MTKHLRSLRWSQLLRSEYTKIIVLGIIIFAFDFGIWFGLRVGLRTQYPLLAVATPSMTPTLPVGTLIVVQGVPSGSEISAAYGNGDIIVFRKPGTVAPFHLPFTSDTSELIVHRVVEKTNITGTWYFRTKGDNNSDSDIWHGDDTLSGMLSERLLIGRVVSWVPWVGHVPLFIRTPQGMFVVVLLILIIIFIEYIPIPKKTS